jgi:hypothetical protein
VLDDLVLQDSVSQARRLLDADAPEDALIAIDKALGVVPNDAEVRALKADASLRLAELKLRSGGGSAGLIEGALTDAFDYYQRAAIRPCVVRNRAAWLLGRWSRPSNSRVAGATPKDALGHDSRDATGLGLLPERIRAEVCGLLLGAARAARGRLGALPRSEDA